MFSYVELAESCVLCLSVNREGDESFERKEIKTNDVLDAYVCMYVCMYEMRCMYLRI